jgi:hypothetical protein
MIIQINVSFVDKTATLKCTKTMTETGTTPACCSAFCDVYTGPVMDGVHVQMYKLPVIMGKSS